MLNIFPHLAKHWATILAVVVLLLVQANCDLALPSYTSDIVDVGIQQGGVGKRPAGIPPARPRWTPCRC